MPSIWLIVFDYLSAINSVDLLSRFGLISNKFMPIDCLTVTINAQISVKPSGYTNETAFESPACGLNMES
jgi:hypothetical protein